MQIPAGSIVSCRFDPPSPRSSRSVIETITGRCVLTELGKVVARFDASNGVDIGGGLITSKRDFDWSPDHDMYCNDSGRVFTCVPSGKK